MSQVSDPSHCGPKLNEGDPQAASDLLPLVYDELRKLAAAKLAQEKPGQTLQPTALVHEAYLRLVSSADPGNASQGPPHHAWNSRGHFFAAAAEAMRRILVDLSRQKNSLKRGGKSKRIDLDENCFCSPEAPDEVLAMDDALSELERIEPRGAQLVKLRYFAGMTVEEAGEVLGISRGTAFRDWEYARTWLFNALRSDDK